LDVAVELAFAVAVALAFVAAACLLGGRS